MSEPVGTGTMPHASQGVGPYLAWDVPGARQVAAAIRRGDGG